MYLARADTYTGALAWFDIPIMELSEWAETVKRIEKESKRRKK